MTRKNEAEYELDFSWGVFTAFMALALAGNFDAAEHLARKLAHDEDSLDLGL